MLVSVLSPLVVLGGREDVLQGDVLLIQLTVVSLLSEYRVEHFSVLVPQYFHISVHFDVFSKESVDHAFQGPYFVVTLFLLG